MASAALDMHIGREVFYTDSQHTARLSEVDGEVLRFLLELSNEYPDIGNWFTRKVLPGRDVGERKVVVARRHGHIAALGIAKKSICENKICTVRVAPKYDGRGIGIRMFDTLLEWLGDPAPVLSVSKEKLPQFERIFNRLNFVLTSSVRGLYQINKVEYFFNEQPSFLGRANFSKVHSL